jgi:hypothetical protein
MNKIISISIFSLSLCMLFDCSKQNKAIGLWMKIKEIDYECIVNGIKIEHVSGKLNLGEQKDTIRITKSQIIFYIPSRFCLDYSFRNDSTINLTGNYYNNKTNLNGKILFNLDTLVLYISPDDTCNNDNLYNLISGIIYLIKLK